MNLEEKNERRKKEGKEEEMKMLRVEDIYEIRKHWIMKRRKWRRKEDKIK